MTKRDNPGRSTPKKATAQPKGSVKQAAGAARPVTKQRRPEAPDVIIARRLLPTAATDDQVDALAHDIAMIRSWERGKSFLSLHPNTAEANSKHLRGQRRLANKRASVFRAAAAELDDDGLAAVGPVKWLAEEDEGSEAIRATMHRAADAMLGGRGVPLKAVLLWLERFWRLQVDFYGHLLGLRGNFVDERFVEHVAEALRHHGIEPRAYKKEEATRGSLVLACALIRGRTEKQSLRQRWVVNAWLRLRKRRVELNAAYKERRRARRPAPHLDGRKPRLK